MLKRQKLCLQMESLPHDVVGHILERAPAKSLVRFKAVSKQWRSTIESRFFQNRQYKHREQSGGPPDVLMVSVRRYENGCSSDPDMDPSEIESLRTVELGSSSSVRIPTPWENKHHFVCQNSCDGLVCLYYPVRCGFVVNPTTRWHRDLPLSNYQKIIDGIGEDNFEFRFYGLGFGKDKVTGTYKPVVLYNSQELGLDNATTCEVFDFDTNAWRYVTPSAPYRVTGQTPAYLDGSLYWLTDHVESETKVLSLDLHTECFQVISKTPFSHVSNSNMVIATLDNRVCVSAHLDNFIYQDIWLFNSGNKTWDKIFSIDLVASLKKLRMHVIWPLTPLALLDGDKKNKKKKLLYCSPSRTKTLAIQDPETQSCDDAFTEADSIGYPVCYFRSLISIQ